MAVTTAVVSTATISYALKQLRFDPADPNRPTPSFDERSLPLTGLLAAFVFAMQMINVPIAAGTSGHIIGAALAAILLGPWLAIVVMATIVGAQALLFADGGITALGYNLLNLAVIAPLVGAGVYNATQKLVGATNKRVAIGAGLAGFASVLATAAALSLEWLFGATAPVPFDRFFTIMVGLHTLVGAGEAVITGFLVAAVVSARPDLVAGQAASSRRPGGSLTRPLAIGGALTVVLAVVVSQLASAAPDGLERVMIDTNINPGAVVNNGPLADYAVAGISNPNLSLALASLSGLVVVGGVAMGLMAAATASTRSRRVVHSS